MLHMFTASDGALCNWLSGDGRGGEKGGGTAILDLMGMLVEDPVTFRV